MSYSMLGNKLWTIKRAGMPTILTSSLLTHGMLSQRMDCFQFQNWLLFSLVNPVCEARTILDLPIIFQGTFRLPHLGTESRFRQEDTAHTSQNIPATHITGKLFLVRHSLSLDLRTRLMLVVDYVFVLDPPGRYCRVTGLLSPFQAADLEPGLPQRRVSGSDHVSLVAELVWPQIHHINGP